MKQSLYQQEYYKLNKARIAQRDIDRYKKSPWIKTLKSINQRCLNVKLRSFKDYGGRGIRCLITVGELKELWFRDKAYLMEKPSIDRRDNDGNYTFDNCRYLELSKNVAERNIRVSSKVVLQFTLQGKYIKTYKSSSDAGYKLKIDRKGISNCCNNKQKTAAGFLWRFK